MVEWSCAVILSTLQLTRRKFPVNTGKTHDEYIHSNSVFGRTAFLFEALLNFRVAVEGTPFVLLR